MIDFASMYPHLSPAPKPVTTDVDHGHVSGKTGLSVPMNSPMDKAMGNELYEIACAVADKIGDDLRGAFIKYFEDLGAFRDLEIPGTVSEANYIGLQEAIQFLGVPNKVDLVFDTVQYSAEGGFLMPYYTGVAKETTVPGPDPCHGGNLADIATVIDAKKVQDEMSLLTTYKFTVHTAFETVPKYVDITFRMPYTDELKHYIPNITAMYEHLKCGREMRL